MSSTQAINYIVWAFYLLVFGVTFVAVVRRPSRARVDSALLFLSLAIVIGIAVAVEIGLLQSGPLTNAINVSLLLSHPYLLLRLVDDFRGIRRSVLSVAAVGLMALVLGAFALDQPRPAWYNLVATGYFVVFEIYAATQLLRAPHWSNRATRRRFQAAALGTGSLVFAIVVATISLLVAERTEVGRAVFQAAALASGVCYLVAFAPPRWLLTAWREPELLAFLGQVSRLPRLPETTSIVHALEHAVAQIVGTPTTTIGLWDPAIGALRFQGQPNAPHAMTDLRLDRLPAGLQIFPESRTYAVQPGATIVGRAFAIQRALFSENAARDDSKFAELYQMFGAVSVLAAPISSEDRRLGVLVVYTERAPAFVDDDIALVEVLANQAAIVLETHALLHEAALVQARAEATRLKEDFLSAAAHELKTPLTVLVGQVQLLERKHMRYRDESIDRGTVRRLNQEVQRLNLLVHELLDAVQAEDGRLVEHREPIDLSTIVREVCVRKQDDEHSYAIETCGPVVGQYDRGRIAQLVEILIENAVKYSPHGGEIGVRVWRETAEARLEVTDHGIGIPASDIPHIFDRFYRSTNVDDRRFVGMGLGLYIARGIVEQHGGRIWVTSTLGAGTTFHVALPTMADEATVCSDAAPTA